MSIERQKELILKSGKLGLDIPGLEILEIIANIAELSGEIKAQKEVIEKERDAKIEKGLDKEEAEEDSKQKIKDLIKNFGDNIKDFVNQQIATIKQQFKAVKDGLAQIPKSVAAAIANIALPPAIGPVAPNPIHALAAALIIKNALAGLLSIIVVAFTELLKAATKICFVLPDAVLTLFDVLNTVLGVVDSIPG